ncbi:MAG: multidrug effflux MFS transporter [Rhodospirillaceae bacterium]|nr:multidrug effflux MFS transporter [Rhodospirillaceae bacterium]
MGFKEFVSMIALVMAVNALAIDTMLPALPEIGDAIGIPTESGRQWIVTSYLLGFGGAQLIFGTLSDRFGRRPILLAGLAGYFVFSVMSALAGSFESMMVARVIQGICAAATRVLAISIVRDRFAGRQMARVMSLVFIVFLAVPIIAPSLGQLIMVFLPWRWIFGMLALYSAVVFVWVTIRLPETIHAEDRRPISPQSIANAVRLTLTNRYAVGYMTAVTFMFGGMFGYLNSAQQIFADIFAIPKLFPSIFALIAGALGVASLVNSRIVERVGMRVVSHTALCAYLGVAAVHLAVAFLGFENVWTFVVLQAAMMFCFGLMGANFNALAMEPLGHVAGTASSIQGFTTTTGGALLGFLVGQQFNGSTVPLTTGFLVLGLIALLAVIVTEKGKLFRPSPVNAAAAATEH